MFVRAGSLRRPRSSPSTLLTPTPSKHLTNWNTLVEILAIARRKKESPCRTRVPCSPFFLSLALLFLAFQLKCENQLAMELDESVRAPSSIPPPFPRPNHSPPFPPSTSASSSRYSPANRPSPKSRAVPRRRLRVSSSREPSPTRPSFGPNDFAVGDASREQVATWVEQSGVRRFPWSGGDRS